MRRSTSDGQARTIRSEPWPRSSTRRSLAASSPSPRVGEPDTRNYKVDFSKAQSALPSWHPSWTVESGAAELAAAFQEAGMTLEQFEGNDWLRIKRIREHLAAGRLITDLQWVPAAMEEGR